MGPSFNLTFTFFHTCESHEQCRGPTEKTPNENSTFFQCNPNSTLEGEFLILAKKNVDFTESRGCECPAKLESPPNLQESTISNFPTSAHLGLSLPTRIFFLKNK